MPRFDLFSKRQRDAAKAGQADVYRYDIVPASFRVQLLNIAKDAFGEDRYHRQHRGYQSNDNWVWIDETFCHERGIDPLGGNEHMPEKIRAYFRSANVEDAIDLTEVIGAQIHSIDADHQEAYAKTGRTGVLVTKISEVNYRLREASIGFQFENGRLIRVDSQFVHQEVVKSALTLIAKRGYKGVQEEFLSAHAHYRAGKNKEAVGLAANSLESTFKAIFTAKHWAYDKNSRISDLVKVARKNILWPDYLDNSFEQLTATLQSGLPQIRDKAAAHGQGAVPTAISSYLAAYALHLAATNIVFLVSAADATP